MEVNLELIGKRIKDVRTNQGITQADLADQIGIATSYLSKIENGQAKFGVDILIKIAEILHVSTDELLRPNSPLTGAIYASEFDEILSGCTNAEQEALLQILKTAKKYFPK